MKITRMCSRLLELSEVYAMKRFRRFVSRRDFACLSERVMLLGSAGKGKMGEEALYDAVRRALLAPLDVRDAEEIIPMRDGGTALHLGGGLYIMADQGEETATLTGRVALLQEARQAWNRGEILAICTGKKSDVDIGIDQVHTRFTAA